MRCFIRVVDGKPFEHPYTEENLSQLIKDFDPDNPPEGLEEFIRIPPPEVKFLEVFEGTTYEKVDGFWRDVHKVRQLTDAEKEEKIKFAKMIFTFSDTWTLDENTGQWIPPVPYPNDGKLYSWNNENLTWIGGPPIPQQLES
jgi:hypothetical protein